MKHSVDPNIPRIMAAGPGKHHLRYVVHPNEYAFGLETLAGLRVNPDREITRFGHVGWSHDHQRFMRTKSAARLEEI